MSEEDDAESLKEIIEKYSSTQELTEEDRTELARIASGQDATAVSEEYAKEPDEEAAANDGPEVKTDLRSQLIMMRLPQKVKLAMFGNSICRKLLISEANKMIQTAVLKNPQLQLREVEEFAKNPNCSEHVLRTIAGKQDWIKSYGIKHNLVFNPKCPVDITIKWLKFLNLADIKKVARSKGLPQALVTAAKKKMEEMTPG